MLIRNTSFLALNGLCLIFVIVGCGPAPRLTTYVNEKSYVELDTIQANLGDDMLEIFRIKNVTIKYDSQQKPPERPVFLKMKLQKNQKFWKAPFSRYR